MILFGPILTTFESRSIFGGSWGSIENWLEPQSKPPSGNLACPNPWNAQFGLQRWWDSSLIMAFGTYWSSSMVSLLPLWRKEFLDDQSCVNFINILCPPFWTKVLCTAFLQLQFGFVIFWQKNIGAKAACKLLMKLTTWLPMDSTYFGLWTYVSHIKWDKIRL